MTTTQTGLGADQFTFNGDRTTITYYPRTPGPIIVGPESREGGELQYQGPEGDMTFYGQQITSIDTPLGRLLTVTLHPNADTGAIQITVVVPNAIGVTQEAPVSFSTVAVKSTTRGFVADPGVDRTYEILPLIGKAAQVLLPL